MIVAIERSKFNILYKYDQLSCSLNSVIYAEFNELKSRLADKHYFDSLVQDLERVIPVFEQDHEVLLLELDETKVTKGEELLITFNSIVAIYPLTLEGSKLLFGKLNDNIRVGKPVFEKVIHKVKGDRSIKLRATSAKRLIDIFGLKTPTNSKFEESLQLAVKSIIFNERSFESNFLYSLLSYDKTPNYLPSGNSEFVAKVGIVTLLSLGKDESLIKNGLFYKQCIEQKDIINKGSFFDGWQNFVHLLKEEELKKSYSKVIESISPKFDDLDIFKIAYYFHAIKAHLNRNEKDLLLIANPLYQEAKNDPNSFIHILLLIGYTFSYEELYESIHMLEQAPLLKNVFRLQTEATNKSKQEKKIVYDDSEKVGTSEVTITPVYDGENDPVTKVISTDDSIVFDKSNSREELILDTEKGDSIPSNIKEPKESYPIEQSSKESEEREESKDLVDSVKGESESNPHVKDFEKWVLEHAPKAKTKVWKDFILKFLPSKDDVITMEMFADVLEKSAMTEKLFTKSANSSFPKIKIKDFFSKR
jgi:hypothetical protein